MLPSNHSLHEDLILEELEVFKVSCLFSLLFHFHPFSLPKSKAVAEEGELGQNSKAGGGRQTKEGWHSGDGCSAA